MCNDIMVQFTDIMFFSVVDCDVLDTIENGYIEYSDGTVYQSVATYNCHIGHDLSTSGDEMRTCGSNGMWNGNAPICNSELLDFPLHFSHHTNIYNHKEVVMYIIGNINFIL